MYWRYRNMPAIYSWLNKVFSPSNETIEGGDNVHRALEKAQGQINNFTAAARHTIQDDGTDVENRDRLNFVGATVTDSADATSIAFDSLNASQVTVAEAVTPSYDLAEQGKNMQEIAEMVRGLQEVSEDIFLVDYTLSVASHTVEFTIDDLGDALNIRKKLRVIYDVPSFEDAEGGVVSGKLTIRLNDITSVVYQAGGPSNITGSGFYLTSASVSSVTGYIDIELYEGGLTASAWMNDRISAHKAEAAFKPCVKVTITSLSVNQNFVAGSKFKIIGV